jgi:predicted dehydrogenase
MKRRAFLKSSALIATALSLPAKVYSNVIGAHSQFRLAVIGLRGRGKDHISGFGEHVVAVCDCDAEVLKACEPEKNWQRFTDYRDLLSSDDIDAVSIATPNHTHALIAIEAIRAGKDVYVEKPVSHNVWEGRQIIEAARAHKAIVQCGTQARSTSALRAAVDFVRSGELGPVQYAIGTCYKPRKSIGKLERPLEIPATLDYELWCGPAEKRDLYRPSLHYDWHWDFNTGNGDMGNQGIHQMDIARWFLGESKLSNRVLSIGGRLGYDDAGNTPNTQTVFHQFEKGFLIFETRGLPKAKSFQAEGWGDNMDQFRGSTIGVVVQCEGGYVLITDYSNVAAFDSSGAEVKRFQGDGDHYANFIAAATSDDRSSLHAEIEEGHLSSALCHTGAISHQLGSPASIAEIQKAASFNSTFADSVERMIEHLRANEVSLDATDQLTLGVDLSMYAGDEVFVDNVAANQHLTRDYREPFTIEAAQGQATSASGG